MSKSLAWTVWAVTAAFLGLFFAWPLVLTLQRAFFDADNYFTFAYIAEVFKNPIYLEGLRNSFFLGVATTTVSLLIALPLALLSDRFDFPGKKALTAVVLVPMILPPFVGAIGLRQMFGQFGAFNALLQHLGLLAPGHTIDWLGGGQFWGVVLVQSLNLYPILFLNLTAALANVDPAMEEAAANLGCTGFRRFRRITLPLIMPGVFAGGTIVFIFAFTELGTPLVFDYTRCASAQIFQSIKEISGNPMPFALVAVMLSATLLLYLSSKFVFGRSQHAMMAKATTSGGARTLRGAPAWLCTLGFAGVTLFALLPHIGVVLVSFSGDWYHSVLPGEFTTQHYQAALGHYLTVPSIINSLKYASLSVAFDIVLGLAIAYVIVRTKLPGRWLLDALAMLPLAVPGLVLAFGYLGMTQPGVLPEYLWIFNWGRIDIRWLKYAVESLNPSKDPTLLLVIAYAIRRLPYVVRSAVAGLQQTSETLEEAAQNLGCPPIRTLRRITFPLIAANVLAGGLLAFSFAMLEVSDSLILAQRQSDFPITKAIYELFNMIGDGKYLAAALGVWAMCFLGLTIAIASKVLGKKLGALFRG
jgi:iron(III) transport system permease protein